MSMEELRMSLKGKQNSTETILDMTCLAPINSTLVESDVVWSELVVTQAEESVCEQEGGQAANW